MGDYESLESDENLIEILQNSMRDRATCLLVEQAAHKRGIK